MAKFFLETFGCKFNRADSELIKKELKKRGYQEASEKEADFFVLNTCGVVEKTERKIIKKVLKLKTQGKKVILAGCLPLISFEICKKIADGLIGPTNTLDLYKVVKKLLNGKKAFSLKPKNIDKAKLKCFVIPKNTSTVIVPISEGCLSNCSYCATKKAKGKLKSFNQNEILKNIKLAIKSGAKEIQLTSQDLAIYGLDKGKWLLPDLLKKIINLKGNFKVRLGMMNPWGAKKIFKRLLKIMENKKFYKFLHLPIQSGDNSVLKSMRRNYKAKEVLYLIKKFRKKFKNSMLATDIIVGFPTENKKAFQNTLKIIKQIKPDVLHLFRFSKRAETEAADLKDLPSRIKKERSRILTKVWLNIAKENSKKYLGKKFEALITEKREKNFLARLPSYKAVVLSDGKLGSFVKVKIKKAKPNYLIGKLLSS